MSPADNLSNRNLVSGFSSAVLRSPGSQALLYADGMSFLQQSKQGTSQDFSSMSGMVLFMTF